MLNKIEIDQRKANEGVWVSLLESKFLIASVEGKKFKQAILDLGSKPLSDDELIRVMSESILLDWQCVKDPNGHWLPYSKQLAVIALTTNDAVRKFVDSVSTDMSRYFKS